MNSRSDTEQSNALPESSTGALLDPSEDMGETDTDVSNAIGRIVLNESTSSYVESIHWSAILDGVWQSVTQGNDDLF